MSVGNKYYKENQNIGREIRSDKALFFRLSTRRSPVKRPKGKEGASHVELWARAGNSKCKGPKELTWCVPETGGVPVWLAHERIGRPIGKDSWVTGPVGLHKL